ncbi:STAG-domain-containing protein [Xylariaceae sp. FL0804]|nr:STAG-domain-containing protein [Xylariaceae sp. FL0804]
MPASRPPLMETSDNNATSSSAPRRSGRARAAPQKFSPEPHSSQPEHPPSKRKRDADNDEDDNDAENEDGTPQPEEEEQPPSETDGDEADDVDDIDDDPTPKPRRVRPSQKSRPKKPAAKRHKLNGNGPAADVAASSAPAVRLPSRSKKAAKVAFASRNSDDLYSEIFGSGHSSDEVAAHWYQRYQADDAGAVTDLINCVLLAAGCEQQLTEDDIRDPENSVGRIGELEEAFEQTSVSEYPLISRSKGSKDFRELLVGFFHSLIEILHQTEALYTDEELLDTVQRWLGIMSASALRPFRHTATTICLAMLTSLIEMAKVLDDRITKSNQALQAESNRRGKNKSLVENTKKALETANKSRELVDDKVREWFEIVFQHRYRDVDPKIRAECIEALGTWVCTLPTVYMAPEYLRYLGWLLSDVNVNTRQEVLKQLARVLKRDADNLAHFIDRFRPRLVEMATKDAEISVRVLAVAVVDILRASGMLDPEEVDSVSKLVFDSDIRVRKAVVGFFAKLVQEFIGNKVDEVGGSEAIDELLGDEEDEDYDSLRKDWINIKALAENLTVYDSQLDDEQDEPRHGLDVAADVINANMPESRIALAAQVLYEKMPEINNWQVLAGYLLFDHTTSSKSRLSSKGNSIEAAIKKAVAPSAREEAVLLEVLAAAVKESLAPSTEHDRTKRRGGRLDADAQEDAAMQLAGLIPQLLKKFGSDPTMAATVLRLEHFLDLEAFQQLRQNTVPYDRLLDEIATQFNRHVDQGLLNEASTSFIHARQYEELEELVDTKVATLWDNSINTLRSIDKICELSARGNLDRVALTELSQTLMKISKLARIADCVDVLEASGTSIDSDQPAIKVLTEIVARGSLREPNEELDDPEDEVTSFAIKCCHFYFMWKVRRLRNAIENDEEIPDADLDKLVLLRKELLRNIIQTFSTRGGNDDLRISALGGACDLCGLFVLFRPAIEANGAKYGKLRSLLGELPSDLIVQDFIPSLDAAERAYAQRSRKTLNDPADDEDPLDDEELPPEEDDEESEEGLTEQERLAAELKCEKILCELAGKMVLAILARVVDHGGPHAGKLRKRLNRNKNKLGPTFRDVVSYLDENRLRELRGGGGRKRAPANKGKGREATKKPALSAELIIDDDDDDDDDEGEEEVVAQPPPPPAQKENDPFDEEEEEEEPEPEEGTVEDLRRRELLEDPIEDDDDGEEEEGQRPAGNELEEDDDPFGD